MQGLVDRGLCVERKARIDLGGNLSGNDLQDLLAELYEEVVQCGVNLVLNVLAVLLAVLDGSVDQLLVVGLLGGSENEGRVGGGILRLVLLNGRKVTRVGDDSLQNLHVSFSARKACIHRAVLGASPSAPVEAG